MYVDARTLCTSSLHFDIKEDIHRLFLLFQTGKQDIASNWSGPCLPGEGMSNGASSSPQVLNRNDFFLPPHTHRIRTYIYATFLVQQTEEPAIIRILLHTFKISSQ